MSYKQKKEPPMKKRKVDPPQGTTMKPSAIYYLGSLKPAYKPGLASTAVVKGRLPASPAPSPPDQFDAPSSPVGIGSLAESHLSNEGNAPMQAKNNENIAITEKDSSTRANSTVGKTSGGKANLSGRPNDLQIFLINLLKEAPMSLKALEKAAADVIPNPAKKIEPILKKIATFQAPGRYFLKPGVQLESFNKASSESRSSPQENHPVLPTSDHNHVQAPVPGMSAVENIPVGESGQTQQNFILEKPGEESNALENIDIQQDSSDLVGDTKSYSDSERHGSESGSDSRGRSLVGSENDSSSDSEASTSSKEGSDKDMEIRSNGDRDGAAAKQNGVGSDAVDIMCHCSDPLDVVAHCSNSEIGMSTPSNAHKATKGILEQNIDYLTRSHTSVLQPHVRHCLRADYANAGSQDTQLVDAIYKSRQNENGARQGGSTDGCGESQKKAPVNAPQQQDGKQGPISHSLRECGTHASVAIISLDDEYRDRSLTQGDDIGRKKKEMSLNECASSYLRYEKEKPELKGPINDFSQYKEYVQEYRDKYNSYRSLCKILESYRNEFQKLGDDLEFARGRDTHRYDKIMELLKNSYHEGGQRHKRLKKVFVVLHKELKHLKQRVKDYAFSRGKP